MVSADIVVDIFDTSTWNGSDFELLLDLAHKVIVPHALHQQQCKNHVQMAALMTKNNARDSRLSYQAAGISYIMRPFDVRPRR